ncbi:hypothetical protein M885DRAFT_595730 [Pelagophyceae sp. CCMP2097]|nr:hypothetical protein M885DRAFT_595730 [Pelagophyceae sp. CCMP2097]
MADKYEREVKPEELRDLAAALLDVSKELKHMVAPLLKRHSCVPRLAERPVLQECVSSGDVFSDALKAHGLRTTLERLGDEVRADPTAGPRLNAQWWAVLQERLQDDNVKRAEFGHTQDVDVRELCELMNQASLCLDMGRTKFGEGNWQLALDRYTAGVEMLQHARFHEAGGNAQMLEGATCRLLRNQAACALKLGKWGLCAKACDAVLHFRPKDGKALYRKGVAEAKRGNTEIARDCFERVFALVPESHDDAFATSAAAQQARRQLSMLKRKESDANAFSKAMLQKALQKGLFQTDDRRGDAGKAALAPMDDGLKHIVAKRLGETREDDSETTLTLDQVLDLQAALRRAYGAAPFRAEHAALRAGDDGLARICDLAEVQKSPLLQRLGFPPGKRGTNAVDRAIAAHFGDERVVKNAQALFQVLYATE